MIIIFGLPEESISITGRKMGVISVIWRLDERGSKRTDSGWSFTYNDGNFGQYGTFELFMIAIDLKENHKVNDDDHYISFGILIEPELSQ